MKKQYIIPIFVPHLGCPNDCVFCNQKSISGQKSNMTKEKAKKIIDDYLRSIKDEEAEIEIAFFKISGIASVFNFLFSPSIIARLSKIA